jgi:hypothetical protein
MRSTLILLAIAIALASAGPCPHPEDPGCCLQKVQVLSPGGKSEMVPMEYDASNKQVRTKEIILKNPIEITEQ